MISIKLLANKDTKYLSPQGLLSGGGGLVSTASDYSRFLSMLANEGKFKGIEILEKTSIDKMLTSYTKGLNTSFLPKIYPNSGFGYGLGIKESSIGNQAEGSFYWAGKGGTLFWVDPANQLIVVAMMQAEDAWPKVNRWLVKEVYDLL